MASSLGSMVVSLGLNATEFITGLTKSEYEARKFAQNMERVGKQAGQFLGIAASAAAAGLFLMTKNSIDAADHLNDLAKKTGIAVDTLGGLGFAASQAGTDLEGVGKSVGKLNLQIAGAIAGNEEAQQAFRALGISMKELRDNSPDQTLAKIADRFAGYEDGPNKAALANRLFGKSYQDILPLLDEGGAKLQANVEYYKRYGGVTAEVAKQADEFNDTIKKIELLSGTFARTLAAELLPSLQAVGNEFLAAKEKGDQFKGAASDVAEFLKGIAVATLYTTTAFVQLGTVIGARAAQLAAFAHLDFKGASFIGDEVKKDIAESTARYEKLAAAIRNTRDLSGTSNNAFFFNRTITHKGPAPALPGAGGDAAKQLLDGQLKALEAFIRAEQDTLSQREHFLHEYYSDDLIGITDYFATRREVIADSLQKVVAAYDAEIVAAKAAAATARNAGERVDAENKVADAIAKRAKAEQDAAIKGIDLYLDETRAAKQFQHSIEQVALTIAQMRGDPNAAAFGFDLANEQINKQIALQKQSPDPALRAQAEIGERYQAELRSRTLAQDELTKATTAYGTTLEKVGIAQSRTDLLLQTGAIGEIDAMNRRSDIAKAYIETLTKQADAAERVARAMGAGPAQDAALANIERMRLQIQQLGADTGLLAKKFSDIFEGGFSTFLTDIVSGTKSVKQAFLDMGKSVEQQISKIAADQISKQLFGEGGPFGGIGKLFGGIFGGKDASSIGAEATGAAALTGSAGALTASGGILSTAGSSLIAAAATLSGTSAISAGGSLVGGNLFGNSFFGSNGAGVGFGTGPGFATGGFPPVGKLSVVGERGPELFVPNAAGKIIPNNVFEAMRTQRVFNAPITINVPAGTSRASANQIALAAYRGIAKAVRQDG